MTFQERWDWDWKRFWIEET